jgi:hypothetical protein
MNTIVIIFAAIIGIALLAFILLQVFFALTKKWKDKDVI